MPIGVGSYVRINEDEGEGLPAPFRYYAFGGRVGVVREVMRDGGWRVAFESDYPGGKPRLIVLTRRQVTQLSSRPPTSAPGQPRA